MRVSPFWRSGLSFCILLLAIVPAIDFYFSREIRREALAAGNEELGVLARVAQAHPPNFRDARSLGIWISQMAASGTEILILQSDGRVMADSAAPNKVGADAAADGNEVRSAMPGSATPGAEISEAALEPEFRQALATGEGRAVRHDAALGRDAIYLAVRLDVPARESAPGTSGGGEVTGKSGERASINAPIYLRLSLALTEADRAVAVFGRRLWAAALVLLLFGGGASLLVARNVSRRIGQLKEFSLRVAAGDFRRLEVDTGGDELDGLAHALNHSAAQMEATIRILTDERNRSAAILRSMIEGVAVISAQERVLFSNRAFSQILGLANMAVEGRPLVEVVRQSDLLGIIKRVLAGREEVTSEIIVGTIRPRSFAVTAAPVRADGPTGVVLVLHEITELRRLERVRQDFAANISHEFRTPLTAIQGFAETLLGGALDDIANRRRFVEIIRDHATRLARLTADLLKLSRIEAGRLEIEFLPVSVGQLIEVCLETARLKAAQRDLFLDVRVPPGLPLVRGDSNRLQEVLQNLLDNAVQYTQAGGRIELSASRVDDAVVLTVADTGIGIPRAEQERIFERFYRVDAARSREAGGTGLGLSIARHIVEAHGGQLWVESVVGEGSRFHFSIPVAS